MGWRKLIVFYDDNGISIDGHVDGWFNDDTAKRFEAYGWRVIPMSTAWTAIASSRGRREALTPSASPR